MTGQTARGVRADGRAAADGAPACSSDGSKVWSNARSNTLSKRPVKRPVKDRTGAHPGARRSAHPAPPPPARPGPTLTPPLSPLVWAGLARSAAGNRPGSIAIEQPALARTGPGAARAGMGIPGPARSESARPAQARIAGRDSRAAPARDGARARRRRRRLARARGQSIRAGYSIPGQMTGQIPGQMTGQIPGQLTC